MNGIISSSGRPALLPYDKFIQKLLIKNVNDLIGMGRPYAQQNKGIKNKNESTFHARTR